MRTKSFAVFDSDSHVVEPPVLWEKHLDPEYRTLGKHALWRHEGRSGSYLKVNGEIFRDTEPQSAAPCTVAARHELGCDRRARPAHATPNE